jgi:hypothetical protein
MSHMRGDGPFGPPMVFTSHKRNLKGKLTWLAVGVVGVDWVLAGWSERASGLNRCACVRC